MEELIEIKTEKETLMNELEKLRLDVLKEKNVLESLKQHNSSLQERNYQQNHKNEILRFPRKSHNEDSSHCKSLSETIGQPENIPGERSVTSPNSPVEKCIRYPQENVSPLSSYIPCPEPPPDYPDYRQVNDYPKHGSLHESLSLYRMMLENAGKLWKADERFQDKQSRLSELTTQYGHPPPFVSPLTHMRYSGHPVDHHKRSPIKPQPIKSPPTAELASKSHCEACGAAANFMCSACKGAHYCSNYCQVTLYLLTKRGSQKF